MSTSTHQKMTNGHETGVLAQILETLHTWQERRHQRAELAQWNERDLHDVGLSRTDIMFEADKPFWRA